MGDIHKILALDLGVSSVGWALVQIPENIQYPEEDTPTLFDNTSEETEESIIEGAEILAMGVRLVPLDTDSKNNFEKGKAVELNQNRTTKRQARRGYFRYKKRRIALKKLLETNSMLDTNLFPMEKISLWGLRTKAIQEQISLAELGRVLLHLNQKRGYNQKIKGQAEEKEKESKETKTKKTAKNNVEEKPNKVKKEGYTDKIARNSKELNGKTIGQKVYEELLKNPDYRTKDVIYYRTDYEDECRKILNTQKQFYPDVLTDEFIQKAFNIIYYQRPLKSQKGLIKICPFTEKIITIKPKSEGSEEKKEIIIGSKVAPKSSPLAEYKKILEFVNNLEIREFEKSEEESENTENINTEDTKSDKKKKRTRVRIIRKFEPTPEQRQKLIVELQKCEKMTKKQVLECLGYATKNHTLSHENIEGNKTRSKLIQILGENHPALQFNLKKEPRTVVDKKTGEISTYEQISAKTEEEPFYQLWHVIYSIKDIEECKNALIKRFDFDETTAEKLANIEFTKGNNDFTNISAKVMRHIIPYLEQGKKYSEAMEAAGYKHSKESETKDEVKEKTLKNALELIPRNALRQPVVEKILNQMIHIVNEIIDPEKGWVSKEERENGTFKIHIELARELKANIQERKRMEDNNTKRAKDNKNIEDNILKPKNITLSRNNIIRYRLFRGINVDEKETKTHATCLYSGKTFQFNQVFDDTVVDKDHIIPQSIYPDDSQGNLVLVYKDENKTKSNKTAYDYMFSKGMEEFNKYILRIQNAFDNGAISGIQVRNLLTTLEHDETQSPHNSIEIKGKSKNGEYFIKVTKLNEEKGFAARDLRETSYVTKQARRILRDICREVHTSTGSVTAMLRYLWGYDEILPKWHIQRLREIGKTELIEQKPIKQENNQQTYKETIKDWSKRDDHRHHAIDALVVACTSKSIIQRINTVSGKQGQEKLFTEMHKEEPTQDPKNRLTKLKQDLIKKRIFTHAQVKNFVDNILISYKAGKKVATWNKNKKGKKWIRDVNAKLTLTPRGQLHEESYYGKVATYKSVKKNITKIVEDLDKIHLIVEQDIKNLMNTDNVMYYIKTGDNKRLVKYLKDKGLKEYSIFNPYHYYTKRHRITDISKKDTKAKENFPDEKVHEIIKKAFPDNAKDSDKVKADIPLYLKNPNQRIRAIRMREGDAEENDTYYAIRFNEKGEPITFVKPGNNHHVAIYRDKSGKLQEHICTFWHAVERKKYRIPAVITQPKEVHEQIAQKENITDLFVKRLPPPEWEYVLSMQQNEMFILDMKKEEVEQAIQSKNYKRLSKHLYRVQKLSSMNYVLRHHLATRVDDKNSDYVKTQGKTFKSISAFEKENPTKVRVNRLGEVTAILEMLV